MNKRENEESRKVKEGQAKRKGHSDQTSLFNFFEICTWRVKRRWALSFLLSI